MSLRSSVRSGSSPSSPLVFFVHGRAGSLNVMSMFARVVPEHWWIVYVEAPIADPIGGFSWWDINNVEQRDNQRLHSLQLLTDFINGYLTQSDIHPSRVFAFGFSQGAALLSVLAQKKPTLFDGVALLSGFVLPQEIESGDLPTVFVAHGTDDQVITIEQALEGVRHLEDGGFSVRLITEAIGHKVGVQGMRALKDWVLEQERLA